jgi:hypothetical protein
MSLWHRITIAAVLVALGSRIGWSRDHTVLIHAYAYHRAMEVCTISFFTDHHHAHQATRLLKAGDRTGAGDHARRTDVAASIRLYAEMIEANGPTRGELGIVVSLNLRWLPDYIDLYQQLRLEPVRISIQPTSHDPLAQGFTLALAGIQLTPR